MVSQFLSLVVQPVGIGNPGAQTYHFATGMMDTDVASGIVKLTGFTPKSR